MQLFPPSLFPRPPWLADDLNTDQGDEGSKDDMTVAGALYIG